LQRLPPGHGGIRVPHLPSRPGAVRWALVLAVLGALACANGPDLATRLDTGSRSAADKARDADRRPAAVVEFLGIEPGMTVLDLIAAGGYYSEVLAIAVGPEGRVYAQNTAYTLALRDGANEKAISARLAYDRLPNVARLDRELTDLGLPPGSIDVAFTALNYHDIYNSGGPEAATRVAKAVHEVLKPDGIFAVIDHAGDPGVDNAKLHRIEESKVIESVEAAGFVLEASSDILRHPEDDRRRMVFADGLRGRTDRFVLAFRKAD
jgi:predicted methyltransferase